MAKIVRATTEKRHVLGEVIPLQVPYTCVLHMTNVCNFKCIYCAHSCRPAGLNSEFMSWETFKKCVDDLAGFPEKLKLLLLCGLGEPLAHPDIAKMVAYAKEKKVAETVRIITNASLLTHEMSDRLIDAGLDHLKISIQGLDDGTYKEMCGTNIPLANIMDNIAYFYHHKRQTIVNVKIVADAFKRGGDEQKFYSMFNDICDVMNVEHISPYQELVDYSELTDGKFVAQADASEKPCRICYSPFYMMSVYEDGTIVPCCYISFESYKKLSLGNVSQINLAECWNSDVFDQLRLRLLCDERKQMPICADCKMFQGVGNPEDNIDDYAEILIRKYEAKLYKK